MCITVEKNKYICGMLEFLLKFQVKKWHSVLERKMLKAHDILLFHVPLNNGNITKTCLRRSSLSKCITIAVKYFNCKYTYMKK